MNANPGSWAEYDFVQAILEGRFHIGFILHDITAGASRQGLTRHLPMQPSARQTLPPIRSDQVEGGKYSQTEPDFQGKKIEGIPLFQNMFQQTDHIQAVPGPLHYSSCAPATAHKSPSIKSPSARNSITRPTSIIGAF
ncbi:hypothetical protein [Kozakia baliensis]|uniref:hypothetical protein n=1 Tax=Kozakia baliensis TaxID=153496 RepID=UPI001171C81F|nr:hypothetical protein [Kozakia baliensis]GBR31204.1 hypothetical protein AA0488_2214 [Kozakia baliensis NRIC 0488]GEL62898.1 hypothetical protein KBA01_01840 [Kozakia baliensis]